MRGIFIVFEGIDGAGKSTQVKMLAEALVRRGCRVEVCRDPGGTKMGERIRKILLDPAESITPPAEALLYAASRAQLAAEVIQPALRRGKVVIGDRFSDSTLAYQGFGRGLPVDLLRRVNKLADGELAPDLTVLLDLPPEMVNERLAGRRDRLEKEAVAFFERVRQGYLTLAGEKPESCLILDARRPLEEIRQQVLGKVENLLGSLCK
ncbi:MAG: dTMP kinase [Armatimonadetes bacterium]|nr:dTMP kinase [Armatimonadota bacterium]